MGVYEGHLSRGVARQGADPSHLPPCPSSLSGSFLLPQCNRSTSSPLSRSLSAGRQALPPIQYRGRRGRNARQKSAKGARGGRCRFSVQSKIRERGMRKSATHLPCHSLSFFYTRGRYPWKVFGRCGRREWACRKGCEFARLLTSKEDIWPDALEYIYHAMNISLPVILACLLFFGGGEGAQCGPPLPRRAPMCDVGCAMSLRGLH